MLRTALTCLLFVTATVAHGAELRLDPGAQRVDVTPFLQAFEDPTASLDVESVARSTAFADLATAAPGSARPDPVWWLSLVVHNPTDAPLQRYVELDDTQYVDVRAYVPVEGGWQEQRFSDRLPLWERAFPFRHPVFPVVLPPGDSRVLLRVHSEIPHSLRTEILTDRGLAAYVHADGLLLGFLHGVSVVLTLLVGALSLHFREPAQRWLALYLFGSTVLFTLVDGLLQTWLPAVNAFPSALHALVVVVTFAAGTQFTRAFLRTVESTPRTDAALRAYLGLLVLSLLCVPFLAPPAEFLLLGVAGLLGQVGWIAASLGAAQARVPGARVIAAAWVLALSPIVGGALWIFQGGAPGGLETIIVTRLGSAVPSAVIVWAVFRRIDSLAAEKEAAEALATASQRLTRYFPRRLVERILSGEETTRPGGERREIAIFFSDLRGFTDLSDRTDPEKVAGLLNEYLAEMTALLDAHGATLDKVMGDGIMAFFGAPDPMPPDEQARRAVEMSVAMQRKMTELRQRWLDRGIDQDVQLRVGLHQGYVTVGNFGAEDLVSYTAIGGGVNLAARLEAACTPGCILASFPVVAHTRDAWPWGELTGRKLKGLAHEVRTAELSVT